MPEGPADIAAWKASIEYAESKSRAAAARADERAELAGRRRNPRLAKTVRYETSASDEYPKPGTLVDTYWIKFLDGTYTQAEGNQTETWTSRQKETSDPIFMAHLIEGKTYDYLEEGRVVEVFWDRGRWWIWRQQPLALFELDTELAFGDAPSSADEAYLWQCEARQVHWNDDLERYHVLEGTPVETLWHVNPFLDADGRAIGHIPYTAGQRVFAEWRNGHWEIVTPPFDVWRVELAESTGSSGSENDLEPGGTALANLYERNDEGVFAPNTDVEVTIVDRMSWHRGRARNKFDSPHEDGSRYYVKYFADEDIWEIIGPRSHATHIRGTVTSHSGGGDFTGSDETFEIQDAEVLVPTGGIITDQDPGQDITIYNVFRCDGSTGGEVQAIWDEAYDRWDAQGIEC
jgi:hypothetical protein